MTTVDKFRDAVSTHFARSRRIVWTLIGAGMLLFASSWRAVSIRPEGPVQGYAFIGLIAGLFAVTFVAVSLGTCCNEGFLGLDPRLRCPHCDRKLQIHGALVIETGVCPRCRCRVLADWVDPVVARKEERELEAIVPLPIERREEKKAGSWLRGRRVMVAALYMVIAAVLLVCAVAITGTQMAPFSSLGFPLLLISLVLAGLTPLILAPGPRRDRIYGLFVALGLSFSFLSVCATALEDVNLGRMPFGCILAVLVIFGGRFLVGWVRRYLVPAICPACGQKALLHAARQIPGIRTYHDYFWCLHCSDRFKRLESGPWEKAWSPHDDRFYWLWSSGRCFDA